MPGQNTQQFYDLKPLQTFIDSGFTLLTPNFRLARRIKAAWDTCQRDSGEEVWEPLPVYPLESWLLQQWQESVRLGLVSDRVVLQEGQALELWRRAIEQEQQEEGRYTLLQTGPAASLASQARERLLRWRVDIRDVGVRRLFELDEDCASFLAWTGRFQQLLEERELATAGDCISSLLEHATAMPQLPLLMLDFDDIPPLHQACVEALGSRVEALDVDTKPATCSAVRFSERRAELDAAARWARSLSEREPGARIGIVLSDMAADRLPMEYLMRRAFDCLGEHYTSLPVNFSTGITLDQAPIVRDAMAVLRLALGSVSPGKVAGLLRSRFLVLPDASSPVALKLLRSLYDSGRELVDVADLRFLASEMEAGEQRGIAMGKYLLDMAAGRELRKSQPPSSWLEPLVAVLDAWGWPGPGPLDSLEHQQVQLWYTTLEQLAGYDEVVGAVSFEALISLLQRVLSGQVSQPQTADSSIQVLGPLEAAGLEFDYLWLCGMQGSRWPAAPRPSPFIPVSVQRELQMPHATAEREWHYAQGLMQQYLQGARELRASYVSQLDSIPELPSVLLESFPMSVDESAAGIDESWHTRRAQWTLESIEERRAPAVVDPERAALQGGSALLEDQSQCPFRAFARRRLGAEALGETVVGMSAADRGSLMHRALHLLFQAIPDSDALACLNPEEEADLLSHTVSTALEELPRSGLFAPARAWRDIEAHRLHGLLRQWMAVERQREAFQVAATEAELQLQLEALELRLRVDRIDRLPDGSQLIIDYKSSVCRLQDWLGERPAKPQLLLYSIAGKLPGALAFAQLRSDDCAFVGAGVRAVAPGIRADISALLRGGWEVDSWDALNERWRQQLHSLAAEFIEGNAAVDPQAGACNWCGLQALCRVGSRSTS